MVATNEPTLDVTAASDGTVARLTGCARVTAENAAAVGRQLARLADRAGAGRVLLDLGEVEYLSNMGLVELLLLGTRLRRRGGRLAVTNLRPFVRDVLAVTRMDAVLGAEPPAAGVRLSA